ncbi:uroporphyrinogen-III synthase [Fonticula alba]|uniref:Uroporphyrinogen-III synthase n=1 Tax=Fonticula alba TaxID=691883 RepID=A0A058Z8A1_FONAL|nr:uroporphyrinogen-III synthase [Fonticula alba]KCV70509.1 uroporphyrinogen-III synthase [Fonticula alba]|eukprot:XP_009495025.1 uroporphyrinogen-III synthase [Fonticula alba]
MTDTVVFLRHPDESQGYLAALGAGPLAVAEHRCIPLLRYRYLDEAIDRLSESILSLAGKGPGPSAIILTSIHSVTAVKQALDRLRARLSPEEMTSLLGRVARLPIFAVGPATGAAARRDLQDPLPGGALPPLQVLGEDSTTGGQLARVVISYVEQLADAPGEWTALFPCSSIRREELATKLARLPVTGSRGQQVVISLTEVRSYETTFDEQGGQALGQLLHERLASGPGGRLWLVFFSPSGVLFADPIIRPFASANDPGQALQLGSIGSTTTRELRERGFRVSSTATSPTPAGVAAALGQTFADLGSQ